MLHAAQDGQRLLLVTPGHLQFDASKQHAEHGVRSLMVCSSFKKTLDPLDSSKALAKWASVGML